MAVYGFSYPGVKLYDLPQIAEHQSEEDDRMDQEETIQSTSYSRNEGFGFGGTSQSRYMWFDDRIESYCNWPKTHQIKPQTLAEAGFYYTGF